ncbi:hypothetical protein SUGI_0183050 [Cryptomeria japonica]|uniref:probable methyltransferase TCM_000336 n=1 Tax=Cryptomeria japonica TaxID=3369 RepID=UPI002408DE78|nr:probable methyltransferase TCM_000336 [Cryptomeria japonica]GLJ12057.1 hypothetical protein SUGI_0183050 [Cryptomeria japonica]
MALNTEKVLAMNGGQGKSSYARNSSLQGKFLRFLQPFLQECIAHMNITPCNKFAIADLGCSSGPNSLFIAHTISTEIQDKYMAMSLPKPELQVFFSDLPSSDFNLLFQSLPPPPKGDKQEEEEEDDNEKNGTIKTRCNYFAAGVAGSFYNRLFPKNSLHFVHSNFSLHWLSQVPAEIEDKRSRSWNGGRVFISKDGPVEVGEAYLRQFQKDFHSFLRARSEEVVAGGCMFLSLLGRPDECEDPRDQGPFATVWDILHASFNDMVIQGVIEEDKRDSFNLPFFSPSSLELRAEVEKEGSFTVKRIDYFSVLGQPRFETENIKDEDIGRMVANHSRAVLEGMISAYFGSEVVNPLYENFAKRAAGNASQVMESILHGGEFFVVLGRKQD